MGFIFAVIIGFIAMILLSFIPILGPIIAGIISGYLAGGEILNVVVAETSALENPVRIVGRVIDVALQAVRLVVAGDNDHRPVVPVARTGAVDGQRGGRIGVVAHIVIGRDLDGIVHHVPNGEIRIASNYTRHFARVNLNISVAYGTNLDHAINVLNRVGKELAADKDWHSLIRSAPQVLRVDNLGDSGIDIKVLGDVKPLQQWAITGELRKRIKKAFDEEGIEIPWPHTKVYFGNAPGGNGDNP